MSRLTNTNQLDRIRIQTARAQSPAGRIPVRHEYWLYPTLDDPYLGDLVVNPTGSWTDTGPVVSGLSATTLDDEIAGLTAGTLYSVQWRVRSRSPYFPNSRWLRVDQAGRNQGHFRTPTTLLAAENPALTPPSLLAFPNPFRAGTRLRYTLDEPGRIDVQVFDAAGRLVRTLCAGDRPAGGGELHWDGQDARGLRAAPGIYFVRVVTARAEEAVRIVRMP